MTTDVDLINEENWKKAKGVKTTKNSTNSALTQRDYSVECSASKKIIMIKGYHIWWCSTHHQPHSHCQYDRQVKMRDEALAKLSKINDVLLGVDE